MAEELLALAVRSSRILRIDIAAATVSTFVADAGPSPDGIVVADRVYWTTMGRPTIDPDRPGEQGLDYGARNGGLHAAELDGTGVHDVADAGTITTGKQLALADGWLYWSDREGCQVGRIRPDGSDHQPLVVNQPTPDGTAECVGVAVDPEGEWLYWTQKGPAKGGRGRIFRVRLGAPKPARAEDAELLWDSLPEPIDLEIHDGWLYWTDRGAEPRGNTLNRAPLPGAGENGGEVQIRASGFAETIGLALDPAAGVIYVSDLGGRIRAVPLPRSSATERTVIDLGEPITGIAVVNGR
ncbi:MAG: hypothetical protein QM619_14045 [Micropruina sp.]|uniref:hypothetical protein n=1 Tax=Micropruina sp. TaxID=2737536 RepID=UPI0039E63908